MSNKTEPIAPSGELLRLDPETGQLCAREYTITIVDGPDAGRALALTRAIVVGSDPGCELALSDGTVSRHHLELEPRPDGVAVRDLDSTNGVHLGGARVQHAIVEADAVVGVGRTKLRIAFAERALAIEGGEMSRFGELVGKSASMQALFRTLDRVAPAHSNVVIVGETGTGKDVIARSLHAASPRRAAPFVVFDCAAVAPTLIESELFGHAKGAFTGAHAARRGAFEQANGGTIFLDEIGDLPLEMQPRLLRVLEAGTVKRVGESAYRRVDVRVIAATHHDLAADVASQRFRSDLFYRLSVMLVRVPPLRARLDDLPLLVRHFVAELGRLPSDFPEHALTRFESYAWPGNVRELKNEVERALLLPANAGANVDAAPPSATSEGTSPLDARHARILDALARRAGNQKLAAEDLGISRRTLLNWLDEHGIARPRKGVP
jgi:DNA-binding NtrC family response regulator